ncbi:uncharacterized protein GGS22DRAFT_153353 [Annulohypoxylon maeteangense]|uniref:uncharacterized protein n=1 Tax=Annulohypoxylon maeteangense TaxID=1927788 RepID=UPI0020084EF6|nr:uncharacterized protein GGS22DRAFT_153353 [Annulohypoxylon maeteangense]KAI0889173.1 hypothetical protein GGS22DRAFT_153353 [Annulohypoxylon maeteangense]
MTYESVLHTKRMTQLTSSRCFVDEATGPIKLIDVLLQNQNKGVQSRRQLYTVHEIEAHLRTTKPSHYSHRHLSICQKTSWSPLQTTKELLDLFVSTHNINSSFWDLPSCFYYRNKEVEINHCLPVTVIRNGSLTEIGYTIRYPELKPSGEQWVIRQSGLYYRHDATTSQTVSVLFSPTPNSTAHQKIEDYLLSTDFDPCHIHEILFGAYFPAFRKYIASLEAKLLPITSSTFSTFIDEPLRVGYDNLSALASLDSQFAQASTFLSHGEEVLRELSSILGHENQNIRTVGELDNHRRQVVAHNRTSTLLQKRAHTTTQLLTNTLSCHDQLLAKQQNGNMLRLNKSAVFLTTLTLLYLPASFVATFFGMNFFNYDDQTGKLIGTPSIWIYVLSSVLLTILTFSIYYWVIHHDGPIVKRMSPKIPRGNVIDLGTLARRTLSMKGSTEKSEGVPA